MKVQITNVQIENITKGRSKYSKATVSYTFNGEARSQSVMSFSNPEVFKTVQELIGQWVEVETGKNDAGYNEWRSVKRADAGGTTATLPAGTTRVSGSNYETKEERAARQVLIVKQSSLSAAVATLTPGAKAPLSPEDVKKVAQDFADWVFTTDSFNEIAEMQDDIPY